MIEFSAQSGNWRPGVAGLLLIALLVPLSLAGCGGNKGDDDEITYVELPVEQIYDEAFKRLQRGRYVEAAKVFDEVERQHPYSIWARRATLMSAFSYYQANKYDDAIEATDRFLSLHPGSRDAPYAYYLKAICYYEQISDVGRDQERTLQALNALQDVVRRYPGSEYARDARLKMDLTRDHLAGKEMYVGRYYLNHGQYVGAINRFKNVIETYQTTSHVPEALERLTEAYFALGLNDEAQASAAVLGYNFPDSEWYKDSYELLVQRGLKRPILVGAQRSTVRKLARPSPIVSTAPAPSLTPPAEQQSPNAPTEQPTGTQPATAQTNTGAAGPGQPPIPPTTAPTTQPSAPPQTAASTPVSPQTLPERGDIGFHANEDLRDTWVRRLFRSLF